MGDGRCSGDVETALLGVSVSRQPGRKGRS